MAQNPTVALADGTVLPCDFFGYAASVGLQYIDVPGITVVKAARLFGDEKKTEKITFEGGSETVVREGYTVCVGISLGSESVRVTMRRPFAEPDTAQALESSRREAEQYRLALKELGINTEEVVS